MAGPWDTPPTDAERTDPWKAQPTEAERVRSGGSAEGMEPSKPGWKEALARGAGQGATLGWGDEINGGIQGFYDWLSDPNSHGRSGLGAKYRLNRDSFRREDAAAKEAHPYVYFGGNVLGGLPAGVAAGSGLARLAGAPTTLAGLSNIQRLAALAKTVAPVSAVNSFGMSSGTPSQQAADTAINTGINMLLPFGASKASEKLAPVLQGIARSKAVEALGTKLNQYRGLAYRNGEQELGQTLLDKGIVPWFGGAETMAKRASAELGNQANTIGETIDALDAQGREQHAAAIKEAIGNLEATGIPTPGLIPLKQLESGLSKTPMEQWAFPPTARTGDVTNAGAFARDVTQSSAAPAGAGSLPQPYVRLPAVRQQAAEQLLAPLKGLAPTARPVSPEAIAEEIAGFTTPSDRMSLRVANENLQGLDERVRASRGAYSKELTPMGERLKQLRGILRGEQQAAAERINPELAVQLASAKKTYGNLADAFDIAGDASLRNLANRDISPSDYAVGLASFMAGHPAAAILSTIGHHAARRGGNAFASNLAQLAARGLENPTFGRLATARAATMTPRADIMYLGDLLGMGNEQR